MEYDNLLVNCGFTHLDGKLESADKMQLLRWNRNVQRSCLPLSSQFLNTPLQYWDDLICAQRAHTHPWYDFISKEISINQMAEFLLENKHYPVFLKLLEVIRDAQFCNSAIAAVQENIEDEHQPEPHAELMKRLMIAVKERASDKIKLKSSTTLIDRTLVFYYGLYHQPWHLVGSVFATERMGTRRVQHMHMGLKRLGLTDHELAFTIVHAECDDHHAGEWLDKVIIPSVEKSPQLKKMLARGVAECLQTSELYLDYAMERAIASPYVNFPNDLVPESTF